MRKLISILAVIQCLGCSRTSDKTEATPATQPKSGLVVTPAAPPKSGLVVTSTPNPCDQHSIPKRC
jgi:hypothetical protein